MSDCRITLVGEIIEIRSGDLGEMIGTILWRKRPPFDKIEAIRRFGFLPETDAETEFFIDIDNPPPGGVRISLVIDEYRNQISYEVEK